MPSVLYLVMTLSSQEDSSSSFPLGGMQDLDLLLHRNASLKMQCLSERNYMHFLLSAGVDC